MNDGEKPKIIIDEDWKSQVEREREEASEQLHAGSDSDGASDTEASGEDSSGPLDLPAASFEVLLSSMATQALASLGQFADPATGKAEVNLDVAKLQVDLLAVLEEKTRGNLSEDEAQMMEQALHQLRMIYVASKGQ